MESRVAAERASRRRWHARHFASSLLLPAKPEPSGWHSEPPSTDRPAPLHPFHLVFSRCIRPAHAAAGGNRRPDRGHTQGRKAVVAMAMAVSEHSGRKCWLARRSGAAVARPRRLRVDTAGLPRWRGAIGRVERLVRRTTHPKRRTCAFRPDGGQEQARCHPTDPRNRPWPPPIEDRVAGRPLHVSHAGARYPGRPLGRAGVRVPGSAIRPTRSVVGGRPGPSWPARFDP